MPLNTHTTRTIWRSVVPETETVALRVRTTQGAVESFTSYTLYHVQVRPAAREEEAVGELTIAGMESKVFVIYQDDLDAAGAPDPLPNYTLRDSDGVDWLVLHAQRGVFNNRHVIRAQRVVLT